MSWVKDEWKDGLASNVLTNISELEGDCERLNKEKKRLQFQVDTFKVSLEKCRITEEEIKKEKQDAERNLSCLLKELDDVKGSLDIVKATSKEKDATILNLTSEVAKVKKDRDEEKERRLKMEAENDRLFTDLLAKEEELASTIRELEQHLRSSESKENCTSEKMNYEQEEHKKLLEENRLLKEERALEREEKWIAEKELNGMNDTEIKAQAKILRKRIAKKERETNGKCQQFGLNFTFQNSNSLKSFNSRNYSAIYSSEQ